jgi:hypothetical protein
MVCRPLMGQESIMGTTALCHVILGNVSCLIFWTRKRDLMWVSAATWDQTPTRGARALVDERTGAWTASVAFSSRTLSKCDIHQVLRNVIASFGWGDNVSCSIVQLSSQARKCSAARVLATLLLRKQIAEEITRLSDVQVEQQSRVLPG